MNWPELQRRIAGGETARTEFERGTGDLSGVGKTVCAFANGEGGLLVLGINDAGASGGSAVRDTATRCLRKGTGDRPRRRRT